MPIFCPFNISGPIISDACEAGYYRSGGMEACTHCQGNSVSVGGAGSCTPCTGGREANSEKTECGECAYLNFIALYGN